jgi:hypothetical protein
MKKKISKRRGDSGMPTGMMPKKMVRMMTAGKKRRDKQQHTKEHEVLTKHAWKSKRGRKA